MATLGMNDGGAWGGVFQTRERGPGGRKEPGAHGHWTEVEVAGRRRVAQGVAERGETCWVQLGPEVPPHPGLHPETCGESLRI